jgi:ubiquitin carboxyl-terminal hydrolase 4/11/15
MAKKRTQKDKEREKIKDGEPKGISGLYNLGNSCYLNSILQCLLHLPEFIIYMNSPKLKNDLEYNKKINQILSNSEQQKLELHYKLLNEFEKLLKDIWKGIPTDDLLNILNSKKNSNSNNNNQIEHEEEKSNKNNIIISNNNKYCLDPTDFKKILSEIFPQFAGTYQQDAHEVLTSILDSFHLALNKTVNESGLLIVAPSYDQNLLVRKTMSCLADASHRAVNDSFIDDTFFGQLSSIFSCYKCHKQLSEAYEPFSTLALTIPIEKNINLYILPLNPNNNEQIKLNIIINDNMSYEDLYNQINKITGYNFENYIFYWPNDVQKKNGNIKKRNLRSSKKNNNENNNMINKFSIYENEDIIINESNIDK